MADLSASIRLRFSPNSGGRRARAKPIQMPQVASTFAYLLLPLRQGTFSAIDLNQRSKDNSPPKYTNSADVMGSFHPLVSDGG